MDSKGNNELPPMKRDKVVAKIIREYPEFEELYKDYQQIRDIYSLEKINDYIKLALSVDPKLREGQLIIIRVLQVIGEYLKNTLESPKLSSTTSELLLLSLQKNTREIIIDLRNSLSHVFSLSKRSDIEESADAEFFIGINDDTRKIGSVIGHILHNYKIKIVRTLLKKIVDSENVDQIKDVFEAINNAELEKLISSGNFTTMKQWEVEKLVAELKKAMPGTATGPEEQLFLKINEIINESGTRSETIAFEYISAFATLKSLSIGFSENKIDGNLIRGMKFRADHSLNSITPKIKSQSMKDIAELVYKIASSVKARHVNDQVAKLEKVNKLVCEICCIAAFETGDIKWIEELREKLNENGSFLPFYKTRQVFNMTERQYNEQLASKTSELSEILKANELSDRITENLPSYKKNKKLQAVVEMLVLDIMSILGSSKNSLENNLLFLDDNTPLLTGKCLRNHLAHDNTLMDVLLSSSSLAVILNARKLTSENIMKNTKKIGQLVKDDPVKLKKKFRDCLLIMSDQEKMFAAIEKGNLDDLKGFLQKGADVSSRTLDGSTALHIAAKGGKLEMLKFLLDFNLDLNARNMIGHAPLHIASIYGRVKIVKFLISQLGLPVNDLDAFEKTPLHFAAQYGHKDTVEFLLENGAATNELDKSGLSPLHYAVRNNYFAVTKVLLEKDGNADINEVMGGFTPLHAACEYGHLKIVNLLIQRKANVNFKTDRNWTPLHAAALNGHFEIVQLLLANGANVNDSVITGCTALHYAAEYGREKIAVALLKHGAQVHALDTPYKNTPLHYAVKHRHEGTVKILLKHKANARAIDHAKNAPLHLAAQSGHLGIVNALIHYNADVHAKDGNGATPLYHAAIEGNVKIAEVLIKHGADVNVRTNGLDTPLIVAAANGNKEVVELLLRNKADVHGKEAKGVTALEAAAQAGSVDIMDILIKNQAKINVKNNEGMSVMHWAAWGGHEEAIIFLLKHKADVNSQANNGLTPLHAAVIRDQAKAVKLLLKNKAFVDPKGIADCTPLYLAVEAGFKEIVEILLAHDANVNVVIKKVTPLLLAVKANSAEMVELLLAYEANVDGMDNGTEPITVAVMAGFKEIVEVLMKNLADTKIRNKENYTLLHLAAWRGHKEVVSYLIAKRADKVDARSRTQETPLWLAATSGHARVVQVLIENGANVNARDIEGSTSLHRAAGSGYIHVVDVLLRNGAIVDLKDETLEQRTALELAISYGHLQVVKLLLTYQKVNFNAPGHGHFTMLHIASQENRLAVVKYLVGEGADLHARNNSGSKPIHIAAREGCNEVVKFFLTKGMSVDDYGTNNQTPLHYSAMKNNLELAKFLISKSANVNAADLAGITPLHIAAMFSSKDFVDFLLKNGAIYNAGNNLGRTALQYSYNNKNGDREITQLLMLTEKFIEAVKSNKFADVKRHISAGVCVNAKYGDNETALHFASWKGFDEIAKFLLEKDANPNVNTGKGFSPLHYAAKYSHFKIVKLLLSHGAIYNNVSASARPKTPSQLASDKDIIALFKVIHGLFEKIAENNDQVINDLKSIKDMGTLKILLRARNMDKQQTLLVAAVCSNFSKLEQLKLVSQGGVTAQIKEGRQFFEQGEFKKALKIFKGVLEKRKELFGPDNPEIQISEFRPTVWHVQRNNYQAISQQVHRVVEHYQT